MRDRTFRAVLDARCSPAEIPSAVLPERVQRAIAEKTVEPFRIGVLMAWEIFTFPVAEEFVMFHDDNYKSIIQGCAV